MEAEPVIEPVNEMNPDNADELDLGMLASVVVVRFTELDTGMDPVAELDTGEGPVTELMLPVLEADGALEVGGGLEYGVEYSVGKDPAELARACRESSACGR